MQLCRQRRNATIKPIEFGSKSSPDKPPYNVYLFRQDKEHKPEAPMCTCMPFLTGRKKAAKAAGTPVDETFYACSHIKKAQAQTCDWTEFDAHAPGYVYDGTCPKCGGPVVEDEALGLTGTTKPILDADEQKLTNLEEVRRLAAELKGVAYEPLPVAVVHVPLITAVQKANADPQTVQILADDRLLLTFVWDDDIEGPRVMLADDTFASWLLNDKIPDVIKDIQWPTK